DVLTKKLRHRSGQGPVPGLPEWEYCFHGIGCCLTNRVTGEAIETETGPGFDFYFWLNHLQSVRNHDPITRRMLALHPSLESLKATLVRLYQAGAILSGGFSPFHLFSVKNVLLQRAGRVSRFCLLLEGTDGERLTDALGNARACCQERMDFLL